MSWFGRGRLLGLCIEALAGGVVLSAMRANAGGFGLSTAQWVALAFCAAETFLFLRRFARGGRHRAPAVERPRLGTIELTLCVVVLGQLMYDLSSAVPSIDDIFQYVASPLVFGLTTGVAAFVLWLIRYERGHGPVLVD
jgi:hypothetical protein